MSQIDMFGIVPQSLQMPAARDVRSELEQVLRILRSTDKMPFSSKDLRFWRTVFPQMSRWLPSEEREVACAAFFAELARLEGRTSN